MYGVARTALRDRAPCNTLAYMVRVAKPAKSKTCLRRFCSCMRLCVVVIMTNQIKAAMAILFMFVFFASHTIGHSLGDKPAQVSMAHAGWLTPFTEL